MRADLLLFIFIIAISFNDQLFIKKLVVTKESCANIAKNYQEVKLIQYKAENTVFNLTKNEKYGIRTLTNTEKLIKSIINKTNCIGNVINVPKNGEKTICICILHILLLLFIFTYSNFIKNFLYLFVF